MIVYTLIKKMFNSLTDFDNINIVGTLIDHFS